MLAAAVAPVKFDASGGSGSLGEAWQYLGEFLRIQVQIDNELLQTVLKMGGSVPNDTVYKENRMRL